MLNTKQKNLTRTQGVDNIQLATSLVLDSLEKNKRYDKAIALAIKIGDTNLMKEIYMRALTYWEIYAPLRNKGTHIERIKENLKLAKLVGDNERINFYMKIMEQIGR